MDMYKKSGSFEIITVGERVFVLELSDVDDIMELCGPLKVVFLNNPELKTLDIQKLQSLFGEALGDKKSSAIESSLESGIKQLVEIGALETISVQDSGDSFYEKVKSNLADLKDNLETLNEKETMIKVQSSDVVGHVYTSVDVVGYGLY